MRKIIIIEEDDDGEIRPYTKPYRINPYMDGMDGYICQYCGKHVGNMEVHLCSQPWCGQPRDDGWCPGGAEWEKELVC